jgi:hypothetical protein
LSQFLRAISKLYSLGHSEVSGDFLSPSVLNSSSFFQTITTLSMLELSSVGILFTSTGIAIFCHGKISPFTSTFGLFLSKSFKLIL